MVIINTTNNDRHILHAWLDKDYRSPGMYTPIALASVLSKVLETILLNRLEKYLLTNDN